MWIISARLLIIQFQLVAQRQQQELYHQQLYYQQELELIVPRPTLAAQVLAATPEMNQYTHMDHRPVH